MFRRLLNKKKSSKPASSPIRRELTGTADPTNAIKKMSELVTQMLVSSLKEKDGRVRIENLCAVSGAVAGFSMQVALREKLVETGTKSLEDVFVAIETNNGRTWYAGDQVNESLIGNHVALYSLLAAAFQKVGESGLPDPREIFAEQAKLIGSGREGMPDVPANNQPGIDLEGYLRANWEPVRKLGEAVKDPIHRTIMLNFTAQDVLKKSHGVIDPAIAVQIIFSAAVAFSKLDPGVLTLEQYQSRATVN